MTVIDEEMGLIPRIPPGYLVVYHRRIEHRKSSAQLP